MTLLLLMWIAAFPAPAETVYSKPVITGAIPAQVEVTLASGELFLLLSGQDLTIPGNDRKWNARDIRLFVRHSAAGGPWQCLYNRTRNDGNLGDAYFNPPREFGECSYYSWQVELWLPRPIWFSREGTLQFLLIKGKCHGPGANDWTEKIRSNIFDIPVRTDVSGVTRIDSLQPNYYYIHQENPPLLTVNGQLDFGTAVLIDNSECVTVKRVPTSGLIQVKLPPGLLDRQDLHQVRLQDSQGTVSNAKALWVYGPPRVTHIHPEQLRTGMGQTTIKLRYGGLKPDAVRGRVDLLEGPGVCSHPPPSDWEALSASFPANERINIVLDGNWTRCAGTLHLWLVSKAGDCRDSITIVKPTPVVPLRPPAKFSKAPVSARISALGRGFRPQLKRLAHKVVELKPETEIRRDFQSLIKNTLAAAGDSPGASRAALESLKNELEKEIWAQERDKQEQLTAAQREHIRRLMAMLKEMARLQAQAVSTTRH
ncbi:MAG: hypothetical protein JXA62_08430 [Candidatus Aminicenantes bacterium]|nr:hypothetical protein [Candidatus Aminicenantes bacterium]